MPSAQFDILSARPLPEPICSPPCLAPPQPGRERFDRHLQQAQQRQDPESSSASPAPGERPAEQAGPPSEDNRPSNEAAGAPTEEAPSNVVNDEDSTDAQPDDKPVQDDASIDEAKEQEQSEEAIRDELVLEQGQGPEVSVVAPPPEPDAAAESLTVEPEAEEQTDAAGDKLLEKSSPEKQSPSNLPLNPATKASKQPAHEEGPQIVADTPEQPASAGTATDAEGAEPSATGLPGRDGEASAKEVATQIEPTNEPPRDESPEAPGKESPASSKAGVEQQVTPTAGVAESVDASAAVAVNASQGESSRRRGAAKERGGEAASPISASQPATQAEQEAAASVTVASSLTTSEVEVTESAATTKIAPTTAEPVDREFRSAPNEVQETRAGSGRNAGRGLEQGSDAARPDQLTQAERVRFVHRVSNAFQMAQERGGEVRLRLSPPELGQMRLQVTLEQGVLSARLEVETAAARTVLLENMPLLRERLGGQEIKLGAFDIDLMDQPHDGGQEAFMGDSQHSRDERRPRHLARPASMESQPAAPASRRSPGNPENGLNVLI